MARRNPDRIDFTQHAQGVTVVKFYKSDGRDVPDPEGACLRGPEFDLARALAWCEAHGYAVRRWPGGARAWKGQPWAVRTRQQIRRRRVEVEGLVRGGHLPGGFFFAGLDFALDT